MKKIQIIIVMCCHVLAHLSGQIYIYVAHQFENQLKSEMVDEKGSLKAWSYKCLVSDLAQ